MSIIIGIIYFTYSIFSKQLIFYMKYTEEISQFNQLDMLLKKDLFLTKELIKSQDALSLILNDNSVIEYQVTDHKMIRVLNFQKSEFITPIISYNFLPPINETNTTYFTIDFSVFNDTIHTSYHKNFGISKTINTTFLSDEF